MTIVDLAKRFLTLVGSSLAAITALFYAVGYIADTARWVHLGDPPVAAQPRDYLLTGASFFIVLLPSAMSGIVVLLQRHLINGIAVLVPFVVLLALGLKARREAALLAAEVLLLAAATHALLFADTSFLGPMESDAYQISLLHPCSTH